MAPRLGNRCDRGGRGLSFSCFCSENHWADHKTAEEGRQRGERSKSEGTGALPLVFAAAFLRHVVPWPSSRQAISVTVLMGLSCDFCLHLAETYARSPLAFRRGRATEAVQRAGSPISAAAVTTILAVMPIILCTIQVGQL